LRHDKKKRRRKIEAEENLHKMGKKVKCLGIHGGGTEKEIEGEEEEEAEARWSYNCWPR